MERGQLVAQLKQRFGDRLGLYKGIATIDTNGDQAEIFYKEETGRYHVDAVISETGFGRAVSYEFLTLDEAMNAIDRLIAIEGPMDGKAQIDAVVAAPVLPAVVRPAVQETEASDVAA